jgi:hypothetical protein
MNKRNIGKRRREAKEKRLDIKAERMKFHSEKLPVGRALAAATVSITIPVRCEQQFWKSK